MKEPANSLAGAHRQHVGIDNLQDTLLPVSRIRGLRLGAHKSSRKGFSEFSYRQDSMPAKTRDGEHIGKHGRRSIADSCGVRVPAGLEAVPPNRYQRLAHILQGAGCARGYRRSKSRTTRNPA